jgi:hypothetical protein
MLRAFGNYQQNDSTKWLSLIQHQTNRPEWEIGNVPNLELHRCKPPHLIEWKGYPEAREPKENKNTPRLLKAFHKQNPLAIGTLEIQKGNCAMNQFGLEAGEHIQEQEILPQKSKHHPELKQHPLMSQDNSMYQKSQEKTMETLELEDNNSAQNAHILWPTDDEKEPEIPPTNCKRQDRCSSAIEKIMQQTINLMPKLRATL